MKNPRLPRLATILLCAFVLANPRPAKAASFGGFAEEALYAGATAPLFIVGLGAGLVAFAAGGYVLFDVGEACYFGLRDGGATLTGARPENWNATTSSVSHAYLGMKHISDPDIQWQMVDFGLDPRLQIGGPEVDVRGFRLGLFSAINNNVSGLDICTLAGRTLGDERGIQMGLFNLVDGELAGLQAGLVNSVGETAYGIQLAGLFNAVAGDEPSYGLQVAAIANRAHLFCGLQTAYVNLADLIEGFQIGGYAEAKRVDGGQISIISRTTELNGFQVGVANISLDLNDPEFGGNMNGVQIGLCNFCDRGTGLQVGLWNQARTFTGVQIGLCNVISEGPVPFLPIVNASF